MELFELFPGRLVQDMEILGTLDASARIKADLESRGAKVFVEVTQCKTCEKIDGIIKAIWPSGKIWEIQAIEGC